MVSNELYTLYIMYIQLLNIKIEVTTKKTWDKVHSWRKKMKIEKIYFEVANWEHGRSRLMKDESNE